MMIIIKANTSAGMMLFIMLYNHIRVHISLLKNNWVLGAQVTSDARYFVVDLLMGP